jgi:hypothetical protein
VFLFPKTYPPRLAVMLRLSAVITASCYFRSFLSSFLISSFRSASYDICVCQRALEDFKASSEHAAHARLLWLLLTSASKIKAPLPTEALCAPIWPCLEV